MTSVILYGVTALAVLISFAKDQRRTKRALQIALQTLTNLAPSLLGMTAMIGLLLALTPPEVLASLFRLNGWVGFAVVTMVGTIATIPAPVAFPLAGSLLKMGASLPALAAFVTTLTMVGLVTVPMEAELFGRRFAYTRQVVSLGLAVVIGVLMGVILS